MMSKEVAAAFADAVEERIGPDAGQFMRKDLATARDLLVRTARVLRTARIPYHGDPCPLCRRSDGHNSRCDFVALYDALIAYLGAA